MEDDAVERVFSLFCKALIIIGGGSLAGLNCEDLLEDVSLLLILLLLSCLISLLLGLSGCSLLVKAVSMAHVLFFSHLSSVFVGFNCFSLVVHRILFLLQKSFTFFLIIDSIKARVDHLFLLEWIHPLAGLFDHVNLLLSLLHLDVELVERHVGVSLALVHDLLVGYQSDGGVRKAEEAFEC